MRTLSLALFGASLGVLGSMLALVLYVALVGHPPETPLGSSLLGLTGGGLFSLLVFLWVTR